jgi:ribosomal protein S18 acetylase RimI-like enzyme
VSVRLRPLRDDEYPAFLDEGRRQYAVDLHENGGMDRDQAEAKAARDFERLLPDGLATAGHTISAIEEEATGERIGRLWFADREENGRAVAYLYDITIDEPHRGRGLGRAAMLALEEAVAGQGHTELELNVFGGNSRARGLYRSLGFAETAVHMRKHLVTNRSQEPHGARDGVKHS